MAEGLENSESVNDFYHGLNANFAIARAAKIAAEPISARIVEFEARDLFQALGRTVAIEAVQIAESVVSRWHSAFRGE